MVRKLTDSKSGAKECVKREELALVVSRHDSRVFEEGVGVEELGCFKEELLRLASHGFYGLLRGFLRGSNEIVDFLS